MRRDVVLIAASAGGLPALTSIVGERPRSLPAAFAAAGDRLLSAASTWRPRTRT